MFKKVTYRLPYIKLSRDSISDLVWCPLNTKVWLTVNDNHDLSYLTKFCSYYLICIICLSLVIDASILKAYILKDMLVLPKRNESD